MQVAADDYCYLATRGRHSGRSHEIEMWYERRGDTLYLLAGGGRTADWVKNLLTDPRCTVRIDDDTFAATGRPLDGPADVDEARAARDLVFDKYQPRYEGSLADWRERALPVAIDLHGVQPA
jgi:deazaflavin-dependent oxidoreductase (nitroreductase family)